jgi:acetyl esterase/lipase
MPIQYDIWKKRQGNCEYEPNILHYEPEERRSDGAVVLIPGSGYKHKPIAKQEAINTAEALCKSGITVFVVLYRIFDGGCYPYPLLDGRRAMRWVRYNAKKFNIDPTKLIALGFSAGGHLCVSLTSHNALLEGEGVDEIDELDYKPNYQALCYPVISFDVTKPYTHQGSVAALLGEKFKDLTEAMSFENTAVSAPPTFIFHNFDDASVGVQNSLLYACKLRELGVSVEMHVYPDGGHGVGFEIDDKPSTLHNRDWLYRFIKWLEYNGLLK